MSTNQNPTTEISYTIDKNNTIIDVGGAWVEAAKKGKAEDSLAVEKVIGQPIEHYVCSDVTQMYYDAVFKLCRLKQEPLVRDYRCDSDTHKRFMRVTLTPYKDGRIEMTHVTLREEPFDNPVKTHDDGFITKEHDFSNNIKRCSICNRLKYPGKNSPWTLPEALAHQGPVDVKVIHTVCPDCKTINWTSNSQAAKSPSGSRASH